LSFDLMVGAGTGIVALAALVAWSTFEPGGGTEYGGCRWAAGGCVPPH